MYKEIWNEIGPLVGVVIGAILAPWVGWRWQHRQWSLDNKKQEYRELLDGLFRATEEIVKARPNASTGWNEAVTSAAWSGTRLVKNRIFVARPLRNSGIPEDWEKIVNVAQWESIEPKIEVDGKQYSYTTGAIFLLRNNLEQKLLGIIQKDLGL
jgi:hypothetical protein